MQPTSTRAGQHLLTVSQALTFAFAILGSTDPVAACNVPVFRYALEHWHPDNYRAVVFYQESLSESQQQLLADMQQQAAAYRMNLSLRLVDVAAIEQPTDKELLAATGATEFPLMVLQFPEALGIERPIWHGNLEEEPLRILVHSDVRRELLERLTDGQTAVWVLLESGDAAQDEAALTTLTDELLATQATLELPELTDSPEDALLDGPNLRIEFSILRLRRDDPAEQALISLLLAAEEDLVDLNEPMVFPVFGRGRAMLPLVGPGISASNIKGSAAFLAGACSCQVKELNPGFDLLFDADWQDILGWADSPEVAMANQGLGKNSKPVLVSIPSGSAEAVSDESAESVPTETTTPSSAPEAAEANKKPSQLLPLLIGLLLMGGIAILMMRRA
ncbi:MAG: hypothetical protein KDA66_02070 [Planctomycetaceae bacterium]|nr:hypothetical protein [Planctomycetaceae bacterium]